MERESRELGDEEEREKDGGVRELPAGLRNSLERAKRYQEQGDIEKAIRQWRSVILYDPDSLEGYNNLGVCLRMLGRLAESEAVFRACIERHPEDWRLWLNLGYTLEYWDSLAQSLAAYTQSLRLGSEEKRVHYACGSVLLKMGHIKEAAEHFEYILKEDSEHVAGNVQLGRCWEYAGHLPEAEIHYRQGVLKESGNALAQYRLASCLLKKGSYREGWRNYEYRFYSHEIRVEEPDIPLWDGTESPSGKTILVVSEQGALETFFFLRYCKKLSKICRVVIKVDSHLRGIVEDSKACNYVTSSWRDEGTPEPDLWVPLGSLPLVMGERGATEELGLPYLGTDENLEEIWGEHLGRDKGLSIGISWRGGIGLYEHRRRGFELSKLEILSSVGGVRLISLQKGEESGEVKSCGFPVYNYGEVLDNGIDGYRETGALMKSLSLVITTDNALAHLAGGLGIPVWVGLPECAEWYWGSRESESMWYPSAKLYRKTLSSTWDDLFYRMARDLTKIVGNSKE